MCVDSLEVLNIDNDQIPETPFSLDDRDAFLQNVYLGVITTETLDITTYGKTVSYLMQGVANGFGGYASDFTFGTGLNLTSLGLEDNVWKFSAAKQYQEVRTLSKMVFRGVSFSEFQPLANTVWADYNQNWLKTEYVTAVNQAQEARNWQDLQDNEDIKYLKYQTQKDSRVRSEHKALDGITLPKDDKFWNTYMPKNGWRCRCFVIGQETSRKVTDLSKKDIPKFGDPELPNVFKMNAGKDKIIFSNRHPYFSVPRKDKALKNNNFNLPIP